LSNLDSHNRSYFAFGLGAVFVLLVLLYYHWPRLENIWQNQEAEDVAPQIQENGISEPINEFIPPDAMQDIPPAEIEDPLSSQGNDIPDSTLSENSQLPAELGTEISPDTIYLLPDFHAIQVTEDNMVIMAGQAPANAEIHILDTQEPQLMAQTQSDERGDWFWRSEEPWSPGLYTLVVEARNIDNGTIMRSRDETILIVPERGEGSALAVESSREEFAGSRIISGAENIETPLEPYVFIDTIDYEDRSNMIVSGRALSGHVVRLYLDNQFMQAVTVDAEGHYRFFLNEEVAPGEYILRIDLTATEEDTVLARAEIPFAKATFPPELADAANAEGVVVVQPGNSLWRIARNLYGQGLFYTEIYRANAEQIADPDLIYPGQVFALPQDEENSSEDE